MPEVWQPTDAQAANLGMGNNPFLGQANPYLQQNIDAASADMVNNYNTSVQPAFNRAMVNSGSFGNEGVAQMNAQAQDQLQKNLGNLSNTARAQDYNQQQAMYQWQQGLLNQQDQWGKQFGEGQRQYNQNFDESKRQWQNQFDTSNEQWNLGFDRGVYNDAYAQNMGNLQMGLGLLGTLAGYNQQDLTNANNMQQTPLNYWQQFSQGANATAGQGGSTTANTGSSSNPLAAMMGGAQLGSAAAGWFGNNNYGGNYAGGITGTGGGTAGGGYNTGMTLNNNPYGGSYNSGMGTAMGGFYG